jgi:hypothetical protein
VFDGETHPLRFVPAAPEMNTSRRHHVLLSLQRALLGKATPKRRAVTVQFDDMTVLIAGLIKD